MLRPETIKHIAQLDDHRLLTYIQAGPVVYTPEAIAQARQEAAHRGLTERLPAEDAGREEGEIAKAEALLTEPRLTPGLGARRKLKPLAITYLVLAILALILVTPDLRHPILLLLPGMLALLGAYMLCMVFRMARATTVEVIILLGIAPTAGFAVGCICLLLVIVQVGWVAGSHGAGDGTCIALPILLGVGISNMHASVWLAVYLVRVLQEIAQKKRSGFEVVPPAIPHR